MNTPRALVIIVLIMVGIVVGGIAFYQSFIATATLTLDVAPTDAKLTLDGKSVKTGTFTLVPGRHTVAATRDGFNAKTVTLQLKGSASQTENLVLTATSPESYAQWQSEHPDQVAQSEGVVGAELNQEGNAITQDNPIIQLLPYAGSDFRINAGPSQKHADNHQAIALYIAAGSPTAKTHALNWIKAQGYDPSTYEIIYQ